MAPQTLGHDPLDLDTLYDPPAEHIRQAVMPELIDFHIRYLEKATFFCLATGRGDGRDGGLDASPRGGPPGFVRVLDAKTVAFADWPGNNRIESMRNLQADDRLGMLFLFPGLDVFLRLNGRGRVTDDATVRMELAEGGKAPRTAIIVTVDEVLFHCGKALNRARFWDPASRLARGSLPTPGQMLAAMTRKSTAEAEAIDAHYDHAMRTDLYG